MFDYKPARFYNTRWQLASWYAGVMGLILSLSGAAVYKALDHANWVSLERELESVAGTLHDSLEPDLKQPGRLNPDAQQLLPELCIAGARCLDQIPYGLGKLPPTKRHILGAIHQGNYYMRLLDGSGRLIAVAGHQPDELPQTLGKTLWQTLKDGEGNRYHQITLQLHTQDYHPWGYMQVGRSLKDFDNELATLRLVLLLGLPLAMLLVGVSSWWLAELAIQPIRQSYQLLQQFTADSAHELRTPTTVIQSTVEFILKTNLLSSPSALSSLNILERQSHRLSQVVKDLLLLNRMDRQDLPMQQQPCCINNLISDLVEELEEVAISAEVMLTSDIQVNKLLYVIGDSEQLYRLVSNLIVNAIQYTPAGGNVTARLTVKDYHALIEIQDTGIGIAPEEQKRIFDRFYRVNNSRSTGGSGLGLAIAAAIAIAHQGSLQVMSQLGRGTTFILVLPLSHEVEIGEDMRNRVGDFRTPRL